MGDSIGELWIELADAIKDLYFEDGEKVVFDGHYKIASWCEEGDWQYVIYYLSEDDEWESWEDCSNYFCYYDSYTNEVTSLEIITRDWIIPFFTEEFDSIVKEQED